MAKKGKASDLAPRTGEDGRPLKTSDQVQFWLDEISASKKREKDFRTEGTRVRELYAGKRPADTPFNILWSNVETMSPSLYSQIPRPVVERRYKDDDPISQAAAQAGQRGLEFLLDTNIDGYETFDETLKAVVLDAQLPGRGVSSVKYDADVDYDAGSGVPSKKTELVCNEKRSWNRVYFGYARTWSKVPWVAYEEHIDRGEAERLFGADVAGKIQFSKGEDSNADSGDGDAESGGRNSDERDTGGRETALIYQIWDKSGGRKIRYVSAHYKDDYLKVGDDPLKLTGFFNCPRPIQFIFKTDDMTPTAPYVLYETQAKELNSLTARISAITRAIKARGIYDTELGTDIAKIMEADDNELIPADKSSSLAAEKGLQNAIWFMPLDVLITTLRELVAARESCKQVIYEITGISDIVRGASKASETLGAQQLKSQWGTLRIQPKQAEVQRYARDILRIMLEIAATQFSEDTWARMTGLPYLTSKQVALGQAQVQAAQQQLQQIQVSPEARQLAVLAQAKAAGKVVAQSSEQQQAMLNTQQQIDAQTQQAQQQLQQAQQAMQTPKWSDVIGALKNDMQRAYKIDVETNSTIQPEAAQDKQDIADLMTALGQFIQGVGPLVAQGIMPFQVAQTMMLAVAKRSRFGEQIIGAINQMQPPPPPNDGKAQKAEAQLQQVTQQAQSDKLQSQTANAQLTEQNSQLQTTVKQKDAEGSIKDREHQLALREQKLSDEKKHFDLERKVADKAVKDAASSENVKLDHKRQLTGLEQKNAKTEQGVAKQVDTKVTTAIQGMSDLINQLSQMQASLLKTVGEQSKSTQELVAAVKAPRTRKAKRGPDGRIESVTEETMN